METVILAVWLALAAPTFPFLSLRGVVAFVLLFAGLGLEHIIATNVGQNRPLLDLSD